MSALLPPGWTHCQLGELGAWGSGGTPLRSNPAYYHNGTIPWLVIGDLDDGTVSSSATSITHDALVGSSLKLLPPGTLLIAMYGSIGKLGITGIECATNQAIAFCRPELGVVLRYMFRLLQHAKPDLVLKGKGGTQQNISQGVLKAHLVRLSPTAEQQRIADKLDTVLTRVDTCRDRLARVAPLLKRFRQSVLAAATSGRLTEDTRQSDVYTAWSETDVQSICRVGTGSTPLRSTPGFFSTDGTPWITSGATSQQVVMTADECVTPAAIAVHRLTVYPTGTLLVAMYGEGKTRGQVSELGIPATVNQACAAIVPDRTRVLPRFIKLVLQSNYLQMRQLAEGGNQPNLNLSKIKEFRLRVPCIAEQTEIVRRVESLFAYADRLEARLATARTAVDRLTPSLLAKAFRGELVPQDPNDEPAAELLRRLAQSRPTAAARKSKA